MMVGYPFHPLEMMDPSKTPRMSYISEGHCSYASVRGSAVSYRAKVTYEGFRIFPTICFEEIEIERATRDIVAHHLANMSNRLRMPSIESSSQIDNAIEYIRD